MHERTERRVALLQSYPLSRSEKLSHQSVKNKPNEILNFGAYLSAMDQRWPKALRIDWKQVRSA
jgi:hypothetical protein